MSGKSNTTWLATMIKKHGSMEEVTRIQSAIGRKGGQNGTTGGFAANIELARIAGAKGGRISRRRKALAIPYDI